MSRRYWLMKVEPSAYSIDDLARDGVTSWEGVRNFQARNFIRDQMQVGDGVLFYASNADPSGVTGLAEVARGGGQADADIERDEFHREEHTGEDAHRQRAAAAPFSEAEAERAAEQRHQQCREGGAQPGLQHRRNAGTGHLHHHDVEAPKGREDDHQGDRGRRQDAAGGGSVGREHAGTLRRCVAAVHPACRPQVAPLPSPPVSRGDRAMLRRDMLLAGAGAVAGLGLLDVETVLTGDKTLRPVAGTALGAPFQGFEMHMGRTTGPDTARPATRIDGHGDGAVSADGLVTGSYVHGLLGDARQRGAWLSRIGAEGSGPDHAASIDAALDAIAATLERHVDIDALLALSHRAGGDQREQ